MTYVLRILTGLLVVLMTLAGGAFYLIRYGIQKPGGGVPLPAGVEMVMDSYSAIYVFETGDPKAPLALVDAGLDPGAKALGAALAKRHRTLADVGAVFITHGHGDHIGGLPALPNAAIYALAEEGPQADGTGTFDSPVSTLIGHHNPHPFTLTRGLANGEVVTLGNLNVTAFALPGHTKGSGAYLAGGVLMFGDSAYNNSDGTIRGPLWIFSDDHEKGLASLKALGTALPPQASDIHALACSHSGNLAGFGPLTALSAK